MLTLPRPAFEPGTRGLSVSANVRFGSTVDVCRGTCANAIRTTELVTVSFFGPATKNRANKCR